MGKTTMSMVIFNSYFDITRGYCSRVSICESWDVPKLRSTNILRLAETISATKSNRVQAKVTGTLGNHVTCDLCFRFVSGKCVLQIHGPRTISKVRWVLTTCGTKTPLRMGSLTQSFLHKVSMAAKKGTAYSVFAFQGCTDSGASTVISVGLCYPID